MELINRQVKVLNTRLPFEEITIYPVGDLQYGSSACDFDRFKRFIETTSKNPNAYYIGMGDFFDVMSPSNRGNYLASLAKGETYDSTIDLMLRGITILMDDVKEVLKPTIGRWLGCVEGHHYYQYESGTTTDIEMCKFLEAPFLGSTALVRLEFNKLKENGHNVASDLVIFATHGRGGGKLTASPLNILESLAGSFEGVDVFLMGHQHKIVGGKKQIIKPHWGIKGGRSRLIHRDIIMACTGGYLKGYMVSNNVGGRPGGTYVEKALMNPVSLGGITIHVRPRIVQGETTTDITIES